MNTIIKKIKEIPDLYHASGCTDSQVKEAERELGMNFPQEFIDYVKEYGAISFYGTELMGLNVEGYLNVTEVTKKERMMNPDFPANCLVLENQGTDGMLSVMDEKGKVFEVRYDKKEFLCNSLSEYLDICVERKRDLF